MGIRGKAFDVKIKEKFQDLEINFKLSEYSIKKFNLSKSLWGMILLLNPFVAKNDDKRKIYDFAFWSFFVFVSKAHGNQGKAS